ncbi:MAG: iron ABC transporter permease [Sphaerochaetaceae bacterium]|jgi:iron complex transport system permease protein|nr:iron ABC transporter permease [Sphaerochaetaceae bacterium]
MVVKITTYRLRILILVFLLIALTSFALLVGRYPTAGVSNPRKLLHDPLLAQIVLNVRLPRILLALTGGASLATAGFVFQMLFANPLVEPGFLGISQGAAFGAASAITLWGFSPLIIQLSATFFGLTALIASYYLAKRFRFGGWILRLVLSGIAVGAVFSAGLSIIKLIAAPTTSLQDITFWMMGGLWNTTWKTALSVMPVMWLALLGLFAVRWRINLLSLDERTAHSIGIAVNREKSLLLFVATVATTAIISVAGLIGWVGLIIPHLARRLFGSDSRFALPGSMLLGALFLLASDTLGRSLLSSEIPLGVLTSLVGALLFMVILTRRQTEVKL